MVAYSGLRVVHTGKCRQKASYTSPCPPHPICLVITSRILLGNVICVLLESSFRAVHFHRLLPLFSHYPLPTPLPVRSTASPLKFIGTDLKFIGQIWLQKSNWCFQACWGRVEARLTRLVIWRLYNYSVDRAIMPKPSYCFKGYQVHVFSWKYPIHLICLRYSKLYKMKLDIIWNWLGRIILCFTV